MSNSDRTTTFYIKILAASLSPMAEQPIYQTTLSDEEAADLLEEDQRGPRHIIASGQRPRRNILNYLEQGALAADGEVIKRTVDVYDSGDDAFQYRLEVTVDWNDNAVMDDSADTRGTYACIGEVPEQSALYDQVQRVAEP